MSAARLIDVRAPQEQTEGTRSQILRWLKSSGETVELDEPLLELETDKVTVEIASPAAGVLREVLKQAEEEISPGELLARIEPGASAAIEPSGAAERGGTVQDGAVQELTARGGTAQDVTAQGPAVVDGAGRDSLAALAGARSARAGSSARLSPAVKRLLAQHGLDAGAVQGTGQEGRITVDDVLRHVAGSVCTAARPGSHHSGADDRQDDPSGGRQQGRRVPHTAMRKRIAERMVRSLLHAAPHVTTVFEADFSAVLAHRNRHKEAFAAQGAPLTLTSYVLAACVDAIRAVPEANARWTDDALEIFDHIDVGVGTALPDHGLIVPVIRSVHTLSLPGIARELGRLVGLARENRLAPGDVRGGTFTISNHGVSGSLLAAPIVIHQPQTAILGVGRVEKRPVVIEEDGIERIVARPRAYLTLTIDHRVMDGHRANQFLEVLVRRLQTWLPD